MNDSLWPPKFPLVRNDRHTLGRMRNRIVARILVSTVLMLAMAPRHASAGGSTSCLDAAEEGQAQREKGELRAAKASFLKCVSERCARVIQTDCANWLSEVEQSLPTIALRMTDGEADVTDVKVFVDGKPFVDSIDGKAIAIDPGPHVFRFERNGHSTEERLVVTEGQKNRQLVVQAPTGTSNSREPPGPASRTSRSLVPAWIFGGVGVLGIAGFSLLWPTAISDFHDLRTSCRNHCTDAQVDPVRTRVIAADISLGVGIAALGVATWLFLSSSPSTPKSKAARVDMRASSQGGGLSVETSF